MRLRRNHKRSSGALSFFKIGLFIVVFGLLLYNIRNLINSDGNTVHPPKNVGGDGESYPSSRGQVVDHEHFKLSYIEEHEQSEWVSYKLTRDMLRIPNVPRSKRFEEDHSISTGSANYYDYRGSGYTRGHLAPAGDMAHSEKSMETSFLMSNISPQIRAFNNGVWKELEEQVRDWTFQNGIMHIVTGPILTKSSYQRIGKSDVSVPNFFYKALVTGDKNQEGIAFVIPHQISEEHLHKYVVSIDSLENLLGINLFSDKHFNKSVEGNVNLDYWPVSDARYKLRVKRWNYQ